MYILHVYMKHCKCKLPNIYFLNINNMYIYLILFIDNYIYKKNMQISTHQLIQQDAREAMRVVFSVLTKRICMHKTNFLRKYSNIVLKVILICKLQIS